MKTTTFSLALVLTMAPIGASSAQDTRERDRGRDVVVVYSPQQLDNLVASIALYPDAILAQALIAATFPDQIDDAARYIRANGNRNIDLQPWDVSVKAIAHYPPVLNMMADREDWTAAVGQAYAEQSGDVMDAVQRLRRMARAQGNLVSTEQQNVVVEREVVRIEPAQPRVIYVPVYDPEIVYYRPVYFHAGYHTRYWSFGIGFPIGSWLSYDCDWQYRRVYYDGWYGGGWRVISRPFISINVVYVHPRYERVYYNPGIRYRTINYYNVNRYTPVHRTVTFDNRSRGGPGPLPRGRDDDNRSYGGRGNDDRNYGGRDDNGRNGGRDDGGRAGGGRDDGGRAGGGRDDGGRTGTPRDDGRGRVEVGPTRTTEPARPTPRTAEPRRGNEGVIDVSPSRTTTPAPRSQPRGQVLPSQKATPQRSESAQPRVYVPRTESAPSRSEPRTQAAPSRSYEPRRVEARPSSPPRSAPAPRSSSGKIVSATPRASSGGSSARPSSSSSRSRESAPSRSSGGSSKSAQKKN